MIKDWENTGDRVGKFDRVEKPMPLLN